MMKSFVLLSLIFVIEADFRVDQWQKVNYVWDFGIIASSTVGLISSPIRYFASEFQYDKKLYKNIKKGDIVWTRCRFLKSFYQEILPSIQCPFVLVVSDGDESFPSESGLSLSEIEAFLDNQHITHLFVQNYDGTIQHPKITPIPIGVDYHTIGYKNPLGGWGEKGTPQQQEMLLNEILSTLKPTHERKCKAFVDFQLSDTMRGENKRYLQCGEDRGAIFKKLLNQDVIEYAGWMKRSELWKKKGEYAFSISPHGNGLDCHRTWEDLILGCIVIVKTSSLNSLYEGLPVIIVNDWSEVTLENMRLWLEQYGDAFTNLQLRKKLTLEYWVSLIKSYVPIQ